MYKRQVGYNGYGELGDGTTTSKYKFEVIGDTYVHVNSNVVTLELNKSENLSATLDNKFNLIVDTVDNSNIKYESLNEDIVTVSSNGTIVGKQIGKAEIIATHTITNKKATVFVNVVPENRIAVPEVEISDTHAVALKADGTVWAWGDNTYGQLGTEDNIPQATPVQVTSLENVMDIALGYYNTTCVKNDGTVWTFGNNSNGQLGDKTSSDRNKPVQVLKQDGTVLENIVKVAGGDSENTRTVALGADGNVWIWGYRYGSSAKKLNKLSNVIDISSRYAVTEDGKVIKIDDMVELEVENILRVSEGRNYALFLSKDGKGYATGSNDAGQLGIGTTKDSSDVVAITNTDGTASLTTIKELSSGNKFSMAITKD